MNLVTSLQILAMTLSCTMVSGSCRAEALHLYVAQDGDDAATGRSARAGRTQGPFATLQRARDEIRSLRSAGRIPEAGVVVEVREGTYRLEEPLELGAEDGGSETSPVVYRAEKGKQVRIVGGAILTGWSEVCDDSILARWDEAVRGRVLCVDLKAQGILEYGSAAGGGIELFFNHQPMTLSRWPNEGFVKIADVVAMEPVDVRGTKGDRGGRFHYEGDRPLRWKEERDLWLHGYWFWDWSDERMKVESIDHENRIITLVSPQHNYGYRKGQWFYALNALCEIDQPGEWYVDRDSGILYFYPPSPVEEGEALVSMVSHLIRVQGASHVTFQGFLMEGSRDTAVVIEEGTNCAVVGCTIRNVGGQGVRVSAGSRCSVVGCDLYQMAKGGISLTGGDVRTLEVGEHWADNNHIHHFGRWYRMYHGGIHLSGVGLRASHNLIHHAPHTAIFFGGNEHLIEFNEIHDVCLESNDAGAIYAGRNWTMRGTVIQNNFIHHVNGFEGRGCVGVYLDDMFCGTILRNNVFYRVTRAAFIGGGRDNVVENNLFFQCSPSLHVDARAMGWAKYHTDDWVQEMEEKRTHLGIPLFESPFIDRYPALATLLTGDPYAPEGNVIVRNVHWDGTWDGMEGKAKPMLQMENNLIDEDPGVIVGKDGRLRLRKNSPAFSLGFQPIAMDRIGPYKDARRASWPLDGAYSRGSEK